MTTSGEAFVVTTRSRLRGPWLFPAMLLASLRIRRQLAATSDVVRWASVVAGPSEFWTITIWRSRHHMQEFMRSGVHSEVMWLFSRWLRSFWLMRWRPGPTELGMWDGMALASTEQVDAPAAPDPDREAVLAQALEHLPRLKAAVGPDGAARFEHTSYARRHRVEFAASTGLVVRIRTSPLRPVAALRVAWRLRREARSSPTLVRSAIGVGRPGEIYLLGIWTDRGAALQLLESSVVQTAARRWPNGCWANEWIPENEFGQWDGMRLRRAARSHHPRTRASVTSYNNRSANAVSASIAGLAGAASSGETP